MKRKKLEQRIEDLEQRVARLETLDDEKARDIRRLKTRTAVTTKRLRPYFRFDQEGR